MRRVPQKLVALTFALALVACGETEGPAGPALGGRLQAAQEQLDGGQFAEARSAFQAALESDPSSIDARLGLAESAHRLGDDATAQRAFEEVLGLGADIEPLTRALQGLAEIHRASGDESGARDLDVEADALRAGPSGR